MDVRIKLLLFIHFVFGLCFFVRILREMYEKHLLHSYRLTKIGTSYFIFLLMIVILFPRSIEIVCFCIHIPGFVLVGVRWGLCFYRRKHFQKQIFDLLTTIILNMNAGFSFRDSLRRANRDNSIFIQKKIDEVINVVVFSQHIKKTKNNVIDIQFELIKEFKKIDGVPHFALDRLKNFRKKIIVENNFRRKSGEALYQIRLQSLLMAVLYFSLAVFVLRNFQVEIFSGLFMGSIFLFILGLALTLSLGRSLSWKL